MSRFPRTEAEITALALLMVDGLTQAPDDFPSSPVPGADLQAQLERCGDLVVCHASSLGSPVRSSAWHHTARLSRSGIPEIREERKKSPAIAGLPIEPPVGIEPTTTQKQHSSKFAKKRPDNILTDYRAENGLPGELRFLPKPRLGQPGRSLRLARLARTQVRSFRQLRRRRRPGEQVGVGLPDDDVIRRDVDGRQVLH